MAEEQKKEEEKKVEEKKQEGVIDVDVFGVSIPLPIETARQIISKRDERTSVFKDLADKVKTYETTLADTKRQSEAQKAALEGRLAEAESLFSKRADDKLANIQNHLINREIESVLLSDPTFIADSKEDAVKLLKSDMRFTLSEDGTTILAGDKPAKDEIANWLKGKAIFKKATGATPTGGKVIPGKHQKVATSINLGAAMLKRLDDSKK
jgi:hypothetical protein